MAALASGQIAAAALSLPLNYVAEEQGMNSIGRFIDVIPTINCRSIPCFVLGPKKIVRSWFAL